MNLKKHVPYMDGAFTEEGSFVVKGVTRGGYLAQILQLREIKQIAGDEGLGELSSGFFANGVEIHYRHFLPLPWSKKEAPRGLEVTVVSHENDFVARRVAEKIGLVVDRSHTILNSPKLFKKSP